MRLSTRRNPRGQQSIDYIIDGKGRRIGKKVNGALIKQWIYDGQLRIVAELSGTTLNRFVYGSRTGTPEMMLQYTGGGVTPSAAYRIFSDHLGSPRFIVNVADGSILAQAGYTAFGVRTMISGAEDVVPMGFAGGIFDPDTKLTHFDARDYDARFGRWVSKDPIRFDGAQANLYVYVGNDPINESDINGTGPLCAAKWAAAAFACAKCAAGSLLSCGSCATGTLIYMATCPEEPQDKKPDDNPNSGCEGSGSR